jgi:homoserine kinase
VTVEVPATSANLGAGFDTLALALDLHDRIRVEVDRDAHPGELTLDVHGEGAGQLRADERNRCLAALLRGLREGGVDGRRHAWRVTMHNAIPISRGLGSSAAATVGGLLAADAMLGGGVLGQARILDRAVQAEGHGDNAGAALLGGFVVTSVVGGSPRAVRFEPPPALRVILFVPERPLSTSAMRAALPDRVPFADAVHNVGAAALAVAAMATGRLELLRAATQDRLHEPYRASVYPELPRMVSAARAAGALGACLSGAGSTIIAFAEGGSADDAVAGAMERQAAELALAGRVVRTWPRSEGARVVAVTPS